MRIEFDATSDTELSAVFVAIAVLRGGDLSLPSLDYGEAPARPPAAAEEAAEVAADEATEFAESLPPPLPPASVAAPPPPAGITAPPVPSPAPATGVDVDAEGLPYDNRIHSNPPSKKKDGKWRGKRGLDDATRVAVTAELRQAMAAPAPAVTLPSPMFEEAAPGVPLPPPPAEPVVDAATAFGAGDATPAPNVPPAPPAVAPVAVPAAPVGPATDFASLMRKITGLQSASQLTITQTTEIAQSLGITGVRDLMHRPDLIPSFDALLPVAG